MHILVIDTGTSSMRAILFSGKGRPLATSRQSYTPEVRQGGQTVEQDPEDFRQALIQCCRQLPEIQVDAIAITAQRSSVIPVDKQGRPLHPAIMWHDKRSAGLCAQINKDHSSTLERLGGMRAMPVHSAPKMLYLRRNMTEIYRSAYKLMGIQDWLLHFLTGAFVTDTSLASRSLLMNVESGLWSPALAEIFETEPEKLCSLQPTGTVCGRLQADTAALLGLPADIPVITAGGDQQSAVQGLGALSAGCAVINIGTGSYAAAVCPQYITTAGTGVSILRSAREGHWLLEASAPSAGDAVKWFCSVFYNDAQAFARFSSEASEALPGSGRVICSCSINGTGTPDWNSSARAFFTGLSASVGRREMARALLEAVAADAAENLSRIEAIAGPCSKVYAAGGITGSKIFRHVLCDTLGRPVHFASDAEATARGAWITAAVTLRLCPSAEAAWSLLENKETRLCTPNPKMHEMYAEAARHRSKLSEKINGGEGNAL